MPFYDALQRAGPAVAIALICIYTVCIMLASQTGGAEEQHGVKTKRLAAERRANQAAAIMNIDAR